MGVFLARRAALGTVEAVPDCAGPPLRIGLRNNTCFRDGTLVPVAVIHLNNFHLQRCHTIPYASVVFGDLDDRVRQVSRPDALDR
jgi:hypothetical protein